MRKFMVFATVLIFILLASSAQSLTSPVTPVQDDTPIYIGKPLIVTPMIVSAPMKIMVKPAKKKIVKHGHS